MHSSKLSDHADGAIGRAAALVPGCRQRGVVIRAVVHPNVEQKLKEMAASEARSLSAMIALILTRTLHAA